MLIAKKYNYKNIGFYYKFITLTIKINKKL